MAVRRNDRCDEDAVNKRIAEIKDRLATMADGKLVAWESDTLTGGEREHFWRSVMAFECGPFTTDFDRLINEGIELPDPDSLNETDLKKKLWEVIDGLAQLRVFINQTDHLSDRELYAQLWRDSLHEEIPIESDDSAVWHVDLVGTGSEEDVHLYLKFYADEEQRSRWLKGLPSRGIPAHEDPPYDRDRHLPRCNRPASVDPRAL